MTQTHHVLVSIPFIAGQWSLPGAGKEGQEMEAMFQSPSLRGSGRFQRRSSPRPRSPYGFNPLHCGAVVASRRHRADCR